MTARELRVCPTCNRPLDEHTRADMGLRNGKILADMCPGYNGPSDIDHVLHNGRVPAGEAQRLAFLEYKRNGAGLTEGQRILYQALAGKWKDPTGRMLHIRYEVIPQHNLDQAYPVLRGLVDWLWPPDWRERGAA